MCNIYGTKIIKPEQLILTQYVDLTMSASADIEGLWEKIREREEDKAAEDIRGWGRGHTGDSNCNS